MDRLSLSLSAACAKLGYKRALIKQKGAASTEGLSAGQSLILQILKGANCKLGICGL